jgi:adenosylmethionine-8-amino-7-oxononanoate aminotransferase
MDFCFKFGAIETIWQEPNIEENRSFFEIGSESLQLLLKMIWEENFVTEKEKTQRILVICCIPLRFFNR